MDLYYVVLEEFDPQSSRCIVGTPAGDIDGDGRSDYALTGGSGWNTIPVAIRVFVAPRNASRRDEYRGQPTSPSTAFGTRGESRAG